MFHIISFRQDKILHHIGVLEAMFTLRWTNDAGEPWYQKDSETSHFTT